MLPACLQFVNHTELQSRIGHLPQDQAEAKFALACLMEVPEQYKVAFSVCSPVGCVLRRAASCRPSLALSCICGAPQGCDKTFNRAGARQVYA